MNLQSFPLVMIFVFFILGGCKTEPGDTQNFQTDRDGDSETASDTDSDESADSEGEADSGAADTDSTDEEYWEIEMGTDTDTPVEVTVLDESMSEALGGSDEFLLAEAVDIRTDAAVHTRLAADASITFTMDPDLLTETPELVYVAYWTGNEWVYYLPDEVDAAAGTVRFHTDHFSVYAPTKLTKDKFYDKYARLSAVNKWKQSELKQEMTSVLGPSFDDALYRLGVRSGEARKQMVSNILSLGSLYDAFSAMTTGTEAQINRQLNDLLGTALVQAFQSNPGVFVADEGSLTLPEDYLTTGVNLIGTAAAMRGKLDEGDEQGAIEALADGIDTTVPTDEIAASVSRFMRTQIGNEIKLWHRRELDEAYQVYKNGADGEYGYYLDSEDFTELTSQMNGIYYKIINDAVETYAAAAGMTADDLCNDAELYAEVVQQTETRLKQQFEARLAADEMIESEELAMKALITAFDNRGLLDSALYPDDATVHENIEIRLARLLAIRAEIAGLVGEEETAATSEDALAELIALYIDAEQNAAMSTFIDHLIDEGLMKTDRYMGQSGRWVKQKAEPVDYTEALNEKNLNYAGTYEYSLVTGTNAGIHTIVSTWTYVGRTDTYPDPDMINGETYTSQIFFTETPAIVQPDDSFTVTLTASVIEYSLSYFDGNASGRVDISKVEPDGTSLGSTPCYDENDNNYFEAVANDLHKPDAPDSVTATVTVLPGTGREPGEMRIVKLTGGGAFSGTINVYYIWQLGDVE